MSRLRWRTFAMSVVTGPVNRTELECVTRQMRNPRAPNLILAGQAGDVGTGAADPPALHDRGTSPRLRHMPSEQLPAKSAAKDQNFNRFWLRHEHPLVDSRGRSSADRFPNGLA